MPWRWLGMLTHLGFRVCCHSDLALVFKATTQISHRTPSMPTIHSGDVHTVNVVGANLSPDVRLDIQHRSTCHEDGDSHETRPHVMAKTEFTT